MFRIEIPFIKIASYFIVVWVSAFKCIVYVQHVGNVLNLHCALVGSDRRRSIDDRVNAWRSASFVALCECEWECSA